MVGSAPPAIAARIVDRPTNGADTNCSYRALLIRARREGVEGDLRTTLAEAGDGAADGFVANHVIGIGGG